MGGGNKSAVELMDQYEKDFTYFRKAGVKNKGFTGFLFSKWGLALLILAILIVITIVLAIIFAAAYFRVFSFLPSVMTLFT